MQWDSILTKKYISTSIMLALQTQMPSEIRCKRVKWSWYGWYDKTRRGAEHGKLNSGCPAQNCLNYCVGWIQLEETIL